MALSPENVFMPRALELLAPARDLSVGLAAVEHGADAVYIGAPAFGARADAAASLKDIAALCYRAHLFRVRVFVALNTILYDNELAQSVSIIRRLYAIGVDAVIIQDRGLLECNLPPIDLHASTQCDTRSISDAQELESVGFARIVPARELSPEEIALMVKAVTIPIEVFIHGAICVSYSGACYLSEAWAKRSANRGCCAQMCRLPYNLLDASGKQIKTDSYLLSLRDMNRSDRLGELIEAGASSFKIEGRLKGMDYVKNITAYYGLALDSYISTHPEAKLKRTSAGRVTYKFTPDPDRTFNRSYTTYFPDEFDFTKAVSSETPKSRGRSVGIVQSVQKTENNERVFFAQGHGLSPGDGLLVINPDGTVLGTRVDLIYGNRGIRPGRCNLIKPGADVYCNRDVAFLRLLGTKTASRRLPVSLSLRRTPTGLACDVTGPEFYPVTSSAIRIRLEKARTCQADRIRTELCRVGDTSLEVTNVDIKEVESLFLPASVLGSLRRQAVSAFLRSALLGYRRPRVLEPKSAYRPLPSSNTTEKTKTPDNISNQQAQAHYQRLGYENLSTAFELHHSTDKVLMTTRHCIKRTLGYCPLSGATPLPYKEPLFLENGGRRLRILFDCKRCCMQLFAADT